MAGKPDYPRLVASERSAFAELFSELEDEQKRTASLCEGWSVRDVACHVASANRTGLGATLVGFVASGFSPRRFNDRELRRWRARDDQELAAALADPGIVGLLKLSPPGALTEIVIHQQDVRRPLDRPRSYSDECLVASLDATCATPTGTGSKKRVRGLRLRATDLDWWWGEGPEVAGPGEALIMAANGRRDALAQLTGEGAATLEQRLPPPAGDGTPAR